MTKPLILMAIWIIASPIYAAPLNDTGITQCGNASSNTETCPQADFPNQDAQFGRDVTHYDDSDGHAGFSFTKLDDNGNDLPASAVEWSCVRDNVTKLIWEVKTDDGGLRDKDWVYTWYNSTGVNDGGAPGTANGGTCYDTVNCDTEKYVQQVNIQNLCGYADWNLPDQVELLNLVDFDKYYPNATIDSAFFPRTSITPNNYWSSTPNADNSGSASSINFANGQLHRSLAKSNKRHLRLVHAEQ